MSKRSFVLALGTVLAARLAFSPVYASPSPVANTAADVTPLPSYVLTYAPFSYLHEAEAYFPGDIADFVQHVTPQVNDSNVASSVSLATLPSFGSNVYLTSIDNVTNTHTPQESWLTSISGKPNGSGLSAAPATIIAVNKQGGIVDAFYFYWYPFNYGNTFSGILFGNHVGDWEHTMVRFVNGSPQDVYLSAHSAGTSYTYAALSKQPGTQRPITYIANGDHANYATSGSQPYPVAIIGPIFDETSQGTPWDVTLNYRGYWYDNTTQAFSAAGGAGQGGSEQASETPSWLQFQGGWGNQEPSADFILSNQYCVFSECLYESGPTGPIAKNLGRTTVCGDASCTIQSSTDDIVLGDIDADLQQLGDALKEGDQRGLLHL